jgi:alpha-glucosidase
MLSLYRALLRLRRETEALVSGDLRLLPASIHVLAYERRLGDDCVRVLLNMSDQSQTYFAPGSRKELLLSTYLDDAGAVATPNVLLRANEGLIFRDAPDRK